MTTQDKINRHWEIKYKTKERLVLKKKKIRKSNIFWGTSLFRASLRKISKDRSSCRNYRTQIQKLRRQRLQKFLKVVQYYYRCQRRYLRNSLFILFNKKVQLSYHQQIIFQLAYLWVLLTLLKKESDGGGWRGEVRNKGSWGWRV